MQNVSKGVVAIYVHTLVSFGKIISEDIQLFCTYRYLNAPYCSEVNSANNVRVRVADTAWLINQRCAVYLWL